MTGEVVEKSAKQLEKERKKAEEKAAKLEKLRLKQEKLKQQQESAKKNKETKESKESKESKTAKVSAVYDVSLTSKGEKKNVQVDLPEAYSPKYVEAAWYEWWEQSGFFKPEYKHEGLKSSGETFSIVIPPPNVTGKLHLGHALTSAIQDSLIRWHRMKGDRTLWTPGCDHAGIATQTVVEKRLKKEHNQSRHDLGREKFIEKVWEWKNTYSAYIDNQERAFGCSVDWDRAVFTMDPKMSRAVVEAFVRLHDDGTIYRANRLVNWSCSLKSAISDIEVDKVELSGRTLMNVPGYPEKVEFGVLVSFAYKIVDPTKKGEDEVVVATTRLETMLGDTAVAVHPEDERYQHLRGKKLRHPFVKDRLLPIVFDEMVERDFGTGAVKITPAHDPNDYECGKRHELAFVNILTDDGLIADNCGQFAGMKRFDARKEVRKELEKLGLYRETKDNPMVVPVCSRSKDIVEPMIKPQWYVKCNDMAAKAVAVVKSKELSIVPEQFEKTWFAWMDGIRDWCISRQLWWGHRIPAYLVHVKGRPSPDPAAEDSWVSGRDEKEAMGRACKKFGVPSSDIRLEQDEDVLDTWFSSGLFPFAVFDWPNKTDDLSNFYPGALLETGQDIIFFWVARMVFFGQKLTNQIPFKEVYLHAMVRDAHGRKMSKSLGNVIDPLFVIRGITLEELHETLKAGNLDQKEIDRAAEGQKQDYPNGIPECGTDALRFGLLAYTSQGRNINLDVLRVQGYRFFCNKLWNATRFAMRYLNIEDFRPDTNLLLSMLKECSTRKKTMVESDKKRAGKHTPLPSEGDLSRSETIRRLESILTENSFLSAQEATQIDSSVYKLFRTKPELLPNFFVSKHLSRWYHTMHSMTDEQRDALPKGKGLLEVSSGDLRAMDRWILSRLSNAASLCNEGFSTYNFPQVTTALHNFWLYELCDVYLESLKPLTNTTVPKQVLYHCLDVGLRLISPLMPFISEELFQRLPRKSDSEPPSIMVTSYPVDMEWMRNEEIENELEFIQKIVSAVRSARSEYNIPNRVKTPLIIDVINDDTDLAKRLSEHFVDDIATLAFCCDVRVDKVDKVDAKDGWAIVTISDSCTVHIGLEGLVDKAKEKERLVKKKANLENSVEKLKKAMAVDNYESKVPQDVRDANDEKLKQTLLEIERVQQAIQALN